MSKECDFRLGVSIVIMVTPWRNGSASDSRSEGCVFKSRRGQKCDFYLSMSFTAISEASVLLQLRVKIHTLLTNHCCTHRFLLKNWLCWIRVLLYTWWPLLKQIIKTYCMCNTHYYFMKHSVNEYDICKSSRMTWY